MIYYTAKQAADILQVHYVTLIRWAEFGILRGSKVGRKWRFTDEQIQAVVKPVVYQENTNVGQKAPAGRNLVLPL